MENKRGISGVVVALILVLLALVAAGIIWAVVRNVTESGTGEIDLGTKCLEIDVRATKAACTEAGTCNVTVTRSAGGDDIAGVKLIFTNEEGESNFVHNVPGNIAPLETSTQTGIVTNITNASKVDVAVYFLDESGAEQLCSGVNSFEF
jgi:flagellin-like protein